MQLGSLQKRSRSVLSWTTQEVQVIVSDDGPGFPAQVLDRIGEPYISDRAGARRGEGEAAGGLGLGLFISKALLERTGAKLIIANAQSPLRGATAMVSWPLATFERSGPALRTRTDSKTRSQPGSVEWPKTPEIPRKKRWHGGAGQILNVDDARQFVTGWRGDFDTRFETQARLVGGHRFGRVKTCDGDIASMV